jgi:acyl-CoA synthetase (AMP-forming)/AMP-acid ligase II
MFSDLLRRSARQFRDRPAIRHDDRVLTYRELYERSCRLANALALAGVAPGEVLASLGRNRLESLEEFTAVALGGFVRSPLYWQDAPDRQVFMLERVNAAALIVDKSAWPPLKDALARAGIALKLVLVRDEDPSAGGPDMAYATALAAVSPADPGVRADHDATYVVRFSAGTTGLPKPIAHSERGYHLANQEVLLAGPAIDETDVYLAVSPYSHGSGNLVWPFIARGASHVVINGFDAERALEMIEKRRCTTLFLVPTMIQRLLDSLHARDADLSSIRRIIYGAASIPQEIIKGALTHFGDTLYQTYGQSEIVPLTILTPRDHRADADGATGRLRSAGRASPNSFVRIEGPDGTILPPGEAGEIVGTGPGAMQGIHGDPAASAARFTADGWIRTNDIGWMDEDGYLFVTDRKDDMIISGGFNIAPAEIEDALTRHPQVAEAIVFGAPHPQWGSSPVAVVRLHASASVSDGDLIQWCQERIGSLKKPSRVIITVDALPISNAGKLLRRVARDRYGALLF